MVGGINFGRGSQSYHYSMETSQKLSSWKLSYTGLCQFAIGQAIPLMVIFKGKLSALKDISKHTMTRVLENTSN